MEPWKSWIKMSLFCCCWPVGLLSLVIFVLAFLYFVDWHTCFFWRCGCCDAAFTKQMTWWLSLSFHIWHIYIRIWQISHTIRTSYLWQPSYALCLSMHIFILYSFYNNNTTICYNKIFRRTLPRYLTTYKGSGYRHFCCRLAVHNSHTLL